MIRTNSAREKLNTRIFRAVHRRNLIYNTCWEDPALDRQALELTADDRLMVITSAGCNALDYLLAGCGEVNAVDVNPIQNALLELKTAALPHPRLRLLFLPVRQGPLALRPADVLRLHPAGAFAAGPRLLGQAHRVLPRQGLAQVVLLPRHFRPAGQARPRQRPRRPPAARPHRGIAGGAQHRGAARNLPDQDPPTHLDAVAEVVLVAQPDAQPARRALAAARGDHHAVPRRRRQVHPRRAGSRSSSNCRSTTTISGASTSRATTRPNAARNTSAKKTSSGCARWSTGSRFTPPP